MFKLNSEKGGITVFVIVSFLFTMIILMSIFWKNTNYQVTVLQAEQRIKDTYEKDLNNINEVYNNIINSNNVIVGNNII